MSFKTGDTIEVANFRGIIFPYAGSSAPTGFLLCDGSAVSRTTYADLYALIGTTYGAGNGSTTFNVPDLRGSVIVGAGQRVRTMVFNGATAVDPSTDQITVASNDWLHTGQAVALSGSSLPTGLSAGTYYVIRVSATAIKLAASLANAQNGTAVDITADGSGNCTLTQTLTDRTLGTTGGEESHAMSSTELLAHSHTIGAATKNASSGSDTRDATSNGSTGSRGGNAAMNVMNPYTVLNYIIKT
jgi:microcystin-dependent protein